MEFLTHQEVGSRIAQLRDEHSVSQRALAEALGVDASAMSRIESGERGLSVTELVTVAAFFGVSSDSILRREMEAAPLFRNQGGATEGERAVAAFDAVIDDFFALESATRT